MWLRVAAMASWRRRLTSTPSPRRENSDAAFYKKVSSVGRRPDLEPEFGGPRNFLDELVGRNHTLKIVPRPDLAQERAELPYERRGPVLVIAGVEEKVSERPHVRQLVHDDIDVVRLLEVVQPTEAW